MATKTSKSPATRKRAAHSGSEHTKARDTAAPRSASAGSRSAAAAAAIPDPAQFAKLANMMTPEQAFELYKANAKIALDIINAAVESTAKVRRLQFEGEEQARSMQKKAARHAAEAEDAQSLLAAGQTTAQEAMQQAMQYWSEMFELIVDMQRHLFSVIEGQMEGVPGLKEARAAMALMPDMRPAKELINAMRGVMTSGGAAFESMQRVMSDFTKFAQQSMQGAKR